MKQIFGLLIIIYAIVFFVCDFQVSSIETISHWGIVGWGQLIYSIYTWRKYGNRIISPYIIFLLCFYIFNFGQCLLFPLGVEFSDHELIGYLGITVSGIYKAEIYTLMMLAAFHLGALLFCERKNKVFKLQPDFNERKIIKIGWIFLLVSIIPYYQELIQDMLFSITYGYAALYEREESIGIATIWSHVADFFIPACVCLYVGYHNNRRIQILIEALIVVNVAILFITGGRGGGVILLGLLLALYNYVYKPFTNKQIIVLCFGGFLLLSILSTIADNRNSADRSFELYESNPDSNNLAVQAIAEMGGSMACLIKTQELVPQTEDFRYGSTYLYALTTIIPNWGFWDIHPAKKGANMSDWLTNKLMLGYGTGFSMSAEAYINFGAFGWIMMILLGYLLSWAFSYVEVGVNSKNAPMIIFSMILFFFCLKMPRNNFIGIVRPFFFYTLPIYYLCKSRIRKK